MFIVPTYRTMGEWLQAGAWGNCKAVTPGGLHPEWMAVSP